MTSKTNAKVKKSGTGTVMDDLSAAMAAMPLGKPVGLATSHPQHPQPAPMVAAPVAPPPPAASVTPVAPVAEVAAPSAPLHPRIRVALPQGGGSLNRLMSKARSGEVTRLPVEVTAEYLQLVGGRIKALNLYRDPLPTELIAFALCVAEQFLKPGADGSQSVPDSEVKQLWAETFRRKQERIMARRMGALGAVPQIPQFSS